LIPVALALITTDAFDSWNACDICGVVVDIAVVDDGEDDGGGGGGGGVVAVVVDDDGDGVVDGDEGWSDSGSVTGRIRRSRLPFNMVGSGGALPPDDDGKCNEAADVE
jgi:hypothetical protein